MYKQLHPGVVATENGKFWSLSTRIGELTKITYLCIAITSYQLSFWVGPLDGIQCPHRADVCKSLLVGQH